MKLNQEKCYLLVSVYKHEHIWIRIKEAKIWESRKQKLLGVEIDSSLNLALYVSSLCKKAGKKLSVLARLSQKIINEFIYRNTVRLLPFGLGVSW